MNSCDHILWPVKHCQKDRVLLIVYNTLTLADGVCITAERLILHTKCPPTLSLSHRSKHCSACIYSIHVVHGCPSLICLVRVSLVHSSGEGEGERQAA